MGETGKRMSGQMPRHVGGRYLHLSLSINNSRATRRLQKCPFDAIMIINLPKNLEKDTTHRYGPNTFKLHR